MRPRMPLALFAAASIGLAACGTWDPTAEPEPEATRTDTIEGAGAANTAELTVGDGTFNFSITDCFASPDGSIRFSGRSPDGDSITGEFDPDAPEDATVYVTNSDGEAIWSADATTGTAPEFQVTEEGFQASATFVSDQDGEVEGSLSGTC